MTPSTESSPEIYFTAGKGPNGFRVMPSWLGRFLLNGREVHRAGALGRGGKSIRIVQLDPVVLATARMRFKCTPTFSGASTA
jgi:hypothetical protein